MADLGQIVTLALTGGAGYLRGHNQNQDRRYGRKQNADWVQREEQQRKRRDLIEDEDSQRQPTDAAELRGVPRHERAPRADGQESAGLELGPRRAACPAHLRSDRDRLAPGGRTPELDDVDHWAVEEVPPKAPTLVRQPHGGALLTGGVPGHKGRGGPPKTAIRHRLRGSYEERVPILERLADGITTLTLTETCPECGYEPKGKRIEVSEVQVAPDLQLKALEHMAKFGIGKEMGVDEVREKLAETVRVIQASLPADEGERLLAAIEPIWE